MNLFDHQLLALRERRTRNKRAAHDFLWQHGARALQERLLDIKRDFGHVVESSCMDAMQKPYVLTDDFLQRKHVADPFYMSLLTRDMHQDEIMPFAPASLDGLVSLGELQWINDLPGFLAQTRHALKPDGLFLAAFFGGDTLQELRACLAQAEQNLYGGVSPRVSPFITLQDMAALMQRAQFALPVVDHDMVTVTYTDLAALIRDIRGMGQNNAIAKRHKAWRSRQFWNEVESLYRRDFSNAQNRLNVTVEIIYVLGWSPDASQPQPLKRGSATHSLSDVLQQHAQNGMSPEKDKAD